MMIKSPGLRLGLDRYSGLYLAALFILVYGIWTPQLFLSLATLHIVADEQTTTVMLGIAVLIPLVSGTFDLSVGSVVNLSAIEAAWLQSAHMWSIGAAIAVGVGSALLVGIINGFLVVKAGVNSFIATLGMATVVTAIQEIITGNSQPLAPTSTAWGNIALLPIGGFQIAVVYALVLALLCWWFLDHTPPGRYLYAIGANREASRLAGVRVDRWIWLSLIFSALISGVAGIFYSAANGPSLTFGASLLLPAFAAAFLGSTQLRPGRFNIWGTVIAVYVLAIGVKGLQLITGQQWLNDMFNGVTLIGAVSFAVWRQRRATTGDRDADPPPETLAAPSPAGAAQDPARDDGPLDADRGGAAAAASLDQHE
jgi:ribose transport system permease protein